jgi:MFS family permease
MQASSTSTSTYRALLAIDGVRPLAASMLLARLGGAMWNLSLILFVLDRFHSPVLAGLAPFFGWVPGMLVSPLAGALLDRYGRVRLIAFDMAVAVLTIAILVGLSLAGALTPASLLVVVGLSSLTLPMTMAGTRSLIPLLVPRGLWERGNALDTATNNVTMIAGPALAGVLFAAAGGLSTLLVIGGTWLVAGLLITTVKDQPAGDVQRAHVIREALDGLRYVLHNPVLRGLAVVMSLLNLGVGILEVALPVLFRGFPHGGSAIAGALWSIFGLAALAGALIAGGIATDARERRIMTVTLLIGAAGFAVVAAAGFAAYPLWLASVGMVVGGVVVGPHDIAMFSLRQRAIAPLWMGRAMSVSMSVNALGMPIGTALAGPVIAVSLPGAMVLATGFALLAALLCPLLLPSGRVVARHAI